MRSNRFGGQYGGWLGLAASAVVPTVENDFIEPDFGSVVEVMVKMPGGVTAVDVVFYRYALANGVTFIASAQSTTLSGHGSEVRQHVLSYTHRTDRYAIRLANQTGAGSVLLAYRPS